MFDKRWREEARFAVVNVKTTGFSESDRIVEIACITVVNNQVVEEYDTLIKVNRHPGPAHVHNVTSTMLDMAPSYELVAADIAERLDRAILVAHNLSFTKRMLSYEMARLVGSTFDSGSGVCTYMLTQHKLAVAAQLAGLPQPNHTALIDARIVAGLLRHHLSTVQRAIGSERLRLSPATCSVPCASAAAAVHRPETLEERGILHDVAARTEWASMDGKSSMLGREEAAYLEVLDACLDDTVLEPHEIEWLDNAAKTLQIKQSRREQLHSRYYELIVEQIKEDGVITDEEHELSRIVAKALSLEHSL